MGNVINKIILDDARESLQALEKISKQVIAKLSDWKTPSSHVLVNAGTSDNINSLNKIKENAFRNNQDLRILKNEPLLAKIIALDINDNEEVFYISRVAPPPMVDGINGKIASYRTIYGKFASADIGDEIVIDKYVSFVVKQRILLYPIFKEDVWDSIDSYFESEENEFITIHSLRDVLRNISDDTILDNGISSFDTFLQKVSATQTISKGRKHKIISTAGLRDQAILDKHQDEIFRLPLDSSLFLMGPPGTGKTTTLIRRLGQKLDPVGRKEDTHLLQKSGIHEGLEFEKSWLMFTPTELLKLYVKEAFNREQIAAPDERIKTWNEFSMDIGRNRFSFLRTGSTGSGFILSKSHDYLKGEFLRENTICFEEFNLFFHKALRERLLSAAMKLSRSQNDDASELGKAYCKVLNKSKNSLGKKEFQFFNSRKENVENLRSELIGQAEVEITALLKGLYEDNDQFFAELSYKVNQMNDNEENLVEDEEENETLEDENKNTNSEKINQHEAVELFKKTIAKIARSHVLKRTINPNTLTGKILEWLGFRAPDKYTLGVIGNKLVVVSQLANFRNPYRYLFSLIPTQYRKFRQNNSKLNKWYTRALPSSTKLAQSELDILILLYLRNVKLLREISRNVNDNPSLISIIDRHEDFYRAQILVDEATDFSAIQLACMREIAHPNINSFFACGDFDQRLTISGVRLEKEIKWVDDQIEIRKINIGYRQSVRLHEFARKLRNGDSNDFVYSKLPKGAVEDKVFPALMENLNTEEAVVDWLVESIQKIEKISIKMPSIGILVNSEQEVSVLSDRLDEKLRKINLRAIGCKDGRSIGTEGVVRVFNVEYIKGLEFEAVFFVNVDHLSEKQPELYKQYLYVGATRAATFLSLSCFNKLPKDIEYLRKDLKGF